MNKINARLMLALGFLVYMAVAWVPVITVVTILRWWALPPGSGFMDAFWSRHLDPGQEILLTALSLIVIWFWAGYVKKLINQRLFKGPRTRALEALKSKD
jgi:hypothetical protein